MKLRISRFVVYVFLALALIVLSIDASFSIIQFFWKPFYQKAIDNQHKMYLYILGESTSLGVPYQEKISPGKLLSYQFNDSIKGMPLVIIDLAESGQTIEFNYFKFYFETLFRPHKNALVFIYSGINEDIENEADINFQNWQIIQHSTILSKLSYMFSFFENSPAKYRFRYLQIIKRAELLGYKTVISQLVGNVKDFDPEVNEKDFLLHQKYRTQIDSANHCAEVGDWKSEGRVLVQLQASFPSENAYILYRMGQNKLKKLEFDSAAIYLNRASEINKYLGYAHWKNEILEQMAREKSVAIAKTFDRFIDSSENGIVGHNLINDAHHPNLKGYCILSSELAKGVSVLYGEKIRRNISEEIVKEHFVLNDQFMVGVYYKLVEWYIYETLKTELVEDRISRLTFYLAKYRKLKPNDDVLLIWEMLIAVFKRDDELFVKSIQQINKSNRRKELIEKVKFGFADPYLKQLLLAKTKLLKISDGEVKTTYEGMLR